MKLRKAEPQAIKYYKVLITFIAWITTRLNLSMRVEEEGKERVKSSLKIGGTRDAETDELKKQTMR